ncbi:hypothetical protein ZYGR_0BB01780 [Zygosaccharomyces rouxii]|uniref:MIF4G domain-containing protein n=1 Tax=Zygosaccharomyces rouxii TaxID=4956 RepID=A0A1Q3AL80_ZYGRO|nr:hypothetical protein ZYGR_0BB01780 [Zygosaccharomyces rouxii]
MSDELKSQSSQASVPDQQQQSGTGFEQTPPQQHQQQHHQSHPYHYHGGNNNYSQRGGRNGHHNNNRQGQQRGGRYGSNKYNSYSNNSGQYNRYNNGVGNGNRNYNGGYKSHRGSMNPAAAATAMNMQWPGYYNSPLIYYVPPQLVPTADAAAAAAAGSSPGPAGPSTDASSSSSPTSSASGASTPQPKKIEITTKTGQHLDLNALHSQHSGITSPPNNSGNISAASNSNDNDNDASSNKGEPSNSSESTPQIAGKKDESPSQEKGGNKEDAEKTKREFLEQIKLRKQAMERKKQEEALKKQEEENKAKQPAPVPVPEESAEDKPKQETSKQTEEPPKDTATDASSSAPANAPDAPALATSSGSDASGGAATGPSSGEQEQQQKQEVPAQQPKGGTYAAKLAVIKQQKAQEAAAKAESEKKEQQEEQPQQKTEEQSQQKTEQTQEKQTEEAPAAKEPESEQPSVNPPADAAPESSAEKPAGEDVNSAPTETVPAQEAPSSNADTAAPGTAEAEKSGADDSTVGTMSQLLERLKDAAPIEDVYSFEYPEDVERPDPKYKSAHRKYTYGPTFLLQFKDKVKAKADEEWVQQSISKIVITPAMMKLGKPRDAGGFGGGPGGRGGDFRKSASLRNMEGRSNSRSSSKKKSKRMMDDRKSNRPYTSRRDRERTSERESEEQKKEEEKPKEEVKPLIPSANRWVPKSKLKKAAEKKLAPDGVTELLDREDAERKMKSLLNKLTLEMFDQISSQILQIADQSKWEKQGETLKVVIEQVFHKACDEPHWSSMYAQLCGKVVKELNPEIGDETNEGKTGPKLVLHYLVARCHEEFDKGWTDKLPTKEDGSPLEPEMMSDEYYKLAAAKRRGLGLVRFIGFLYRLNLLTGKMMFECFRRLMKDLNNAPSEETLESVVELLSTVGEQFETDSFSAGQATLEGSVLLDSLFATLQDIIDESKVSSRMKFKLIDIRELREEKNWDSNKKQDGPKTIQQIHEEEKERQMKNNSSRSNSRRVNNSMGGRSSSRRENPSLSKDSFISTRSASLRHPQKSTQKEEPRKPEKSATNMFSALMDSNEDEE